MRFLVRGTARPRPGGLAASHKHSTPSPTPGAMWNAARRRRMMTRSNRSPKEERNDHYDGEAD